MAVIEVEDGEVSFLCPGCGLYHMLSYGESKRPRWDWNGSLDKPTLRPSVLAQSNFVGQVPKLICHFFLVDGVIQFLSDSTHKFSGQNVPLNLVED